MLNFKNKIITLSFIGVIFILILAACITIYTLWATKVLTSKLPTPQGNMILVSGPYDTVNIVPTESGYITEAIVKDIDIYARYGYRAVTVTNGFVNEKSRSDVVYNDQIYLVMNNSDRQDTGFTFKLPTQTKDELKAVDIKYELVVKHYGNKDATGDLLFTNEAVYGPFEITDTIVEDATQPANPSIPPNPIIKSL